MALVVLVVLLALPTVCLAQATEVTGAKLTIREEQDTTIALTLTNRRDVALVAWDVGWAPDGKIIPFPFARADHAGTEHRHGDAIRAGERRRLLDDTIRARPGAAPPAVFVTFALFADGHFEGRSSAADRMRKARRHESERIRYWLAYVGPLADESDELLRRTLLAKLRDATAAGGGTEEPQFASDIRHALAVAQPQSNGSLRRRVVTALDDARLRLAAIERPMGPASPEDEEVTSVSVEAPLSQMVRGYAAVENLRDVPLEGIALRWGTRALTTDLCCVELPDSGPIRRGERREFLLYRTSDVPESINLGFLLFADFSWEGRRNDRDDMLRLREARAADAAYWVPVLTDAALMLPAAAIELLEAKRKDQEAATALRRLLPYSAFRMEIDEIIRRMNENPSNFARSVHETIWKLEFYRVQATRHLGNGEERK